LYMCSLSYSSDAFLTPPHLLLRYINIIWTCFSLWN
jgi:hypothetical protein